MPVVSPREGDHAHYQRTDTRDYQTAVQSRGDGIWPRSRVDSRVDRRRATGGFEWPAGPGTSAVAAWRQGVTAVSAARSSERIRGRAVPDIALNAASRIPYQTAKVCEPAAENPCMAHEQPAFPENDPIWDEARALEASIRAIRRAQGKRNPELSCRHSGMSCGHGGVRARCQPRACARGSRP